MRLKSANAVSGFTLIELIVVIFILSIASALILPSFTDIGEGSLKSDAKRIGNALRYIHDESVSKKKGYLFSINLDNDTYSFSGEGESKSFKLKDDVFIKDILIPSMGTHSEGEFIIKFGPLGTEEPITLHLAKEKDEYTVIFNNISGRAGIYEGYNLYSNNINAE